VPLPQNTLKDSPALLQQSDAATRRQRPRRARAVEAEADLWAALDSGPPSIPSAAKIEPAGREQGGDAKAEALSGVALGQILAERYEVLSVLGEGGMGIVYRCLDTYSGDEVALKRVIIPEGPLANEYVLWFYKESKALAALDHPSVVRARDFGQLQDGSPFLVMDLVVGVSLHDLSHAKMSFLLVWSVVDQILGALAHAHARGIIHGDLKPSNILVEEYPNGPPRVHVLDFGLAWLKQDRHDERLDGAKALEFTPHAGAGTPGYMAPEQIQHESHNVCGATDLYSLGCILYRMLSGKPPFSGESKDLLRHHAFDVPIAPQLRPDAPTDSVHFVLRMLAKQPWDRWEFASEARAEWLRWKPASDSDPNGYQFPTLTQKPDATRPATVHAPRAVPNVATAERSPGLLSIRPSPLVGRDDLRQVLQTACREAIHGQGPAHRLIMLVGPAGVGKSRIAEWLYESVHENGSMVPLRARYRSPRGPLDGMLGAVTQYFNFERADRDTLERTLLARWKVGRNDKAGRTWVAGVAEWLRPLGPISDQPIGPSGIRFSLDTPETRRMVMRYTLRRIARGRPLLLWLDDLHHASESTIAGLAHLHEEETDQRFVMIGTIRDEDFQLDARLSEKLRPLFESIDTRILEVRPMDTDTTCALVRASLPLDDAAVEEAARRSRGNPLFALQQLHAWALAGEMTRVAGRYHVPAEVLAVRPHTTAELWDSRISALPAEHRLAPFAAASLGADVRRIVLHSLLTALELPADEAILSLQNAEILVPRGPGRYGWPHALLYEHLSSRLAIRDDGRRILRAASEALSKHPLAGTRRVVRQRVTNLLGAGDPDAAANILFAYLQTSGGVAREPLSLLSDLELLKGKLQGHTLALKHRWQAEAFRQVARFEEASMHAEIARATFEELSDAENLAQSMRLLGCIHAEQGRPVEGLQLVEQARATFEAIGNLSGLAQSEAALGEIQYSLGDMATARTHVEHGQAHFASLAQPHGRGQCLLLLGAIEQAEGQVERARRRTVEARTEFERAGYRLGSALADLSLARVEHRLSNYHSAERGAQDALATFFALGTAQYQADCERLLAIIGIDCDDAQLAANHIDRFAEICRKTLDRGSELESLVLRAQLGLIRHEPKLASESLARARRVAVVEPEPKQHLLLTDTWLALEQNDAERAYERLSAASTAFREIHVVGDHTPQLLARFSRYHWSETARVELENWRAAIAEKSRRARE
jgi:serine/threonine protein kinase/tetratricopeptide (TPR) repeat protein